MEPVYHPSLHQVGTPRGSGLFSWEARCVERRVGKAADTMRRLRAFVCGVGRRSDPSTFGQEARSVTVPNIFASEWVRGKLQRR